MIDRVSLWHQSAMHGASLVNTRRVVKADFGWTFDHLDVLTITNSLSLNSIKCHSYTCFHDFSFKKNLLPPIIILIIPTYRHTFQLVSVRKIKDLVEVA